MRHAVAAIIVTLLLILPAYAVQPASIENAVLKVTVQPDSGAFEVLDKRIDYTYRQDASLGSAARRTADEEFQKGAAKAETGRGGEQSSAKAKNVEALEPVTVVEVKRVSDSRIDIKLSGRGLDTYSIELRASEPDTLFTTLTRADNADSGLTDAGFPAPFTIDREKGYLLQSTQGDGVLLPLSELNKAKGSPFSFGNALPIYGMTDMKKGYISVLETKALVEKPGTGSIPRNWKEGGYLEKNRVPKDAWDNEYVYMNPGLHNPSGVDVFSYGPDGQPGGDGDNADIGNWESEASEAQ